MWEGHPVAVWAKNTRVPARKVVQRAEFRAAGRPVPSAARVMAEARRDETTYAAFREVGRVIRAVQLLGYLSDAPLSRRVTAATNAVESFNRFSQ